MERLTKAFHAIPLLVKLCILAVILHYSYLASVKQYKITRRQLAKWIIENDIAAVGVKKSEDAIAYNTALNLDDCQQRLDDVRQSIIDLPLGGPQK